MARIYLDNNATTPVLPQVVAAMQPWWTGHFGNASAVHEHGRVARAAVDRAREQVAALLGAPPFGITFTGSGTESDNHALFGLLQSGQHLITGSIEHHAVLHPAQELERRGIELTVVAPDADGVVQPEAIRAAIRPNTALISLMLANNETGVLQPVRAVSALARERSILVHTDAVQCGGKLPIDIRDLGCDLLSLSAHKMHAPQGVGALWVRKGVKLRPLLHGGPQERQRRAGTENIPGIVAFGEAADLAQAWMLEGVPALCRLHRSFEAELLHRIPGATIHGAGVSRLPNTTSVRFEGIDSEALVIALDLKGLAVSGGSACTSGAIEPSHVLRAMQLTEAEARATIRISLSRLTTPDELARTLHLLETTISRLRTP